MRAERAVSHSGKEREQVRAAHQILQRQKQALQDDNKKPDHLNFQ